MSKEKILIVEDDRIVAEGTKRSLKRLGFNVSGIVSYGEKAVESIKECDPDLVLMDIMLKGEMNGIQATDQIHTQFDIPVVYLTAYTDEDVLNRAKITEPFGYIVKPFEERELNTTIEIALYKHKMETKLKESKAWLSTTLRSIGDAVIVNDTKGNITFINSVAETFTGWSQEEVVGKPLTDIYKIINEQTREHIEKSFAKAIRNGSVVGLENNTILITKDGKEIPIDYSVSAIRDEKENVTGIVLVFRDISERKHAEKERIKLQEQLHQSQKMEAIGTLAGGIAHDLNNLLTVILGYSELAMDNAPELSPVRQDLEEIKKAGIRSQDVVKQLLSFSSKTVIKRKHVKISPVIEECLKFLRSSIPTNIKIHTTIQDESIVVLADPTQIHQVIMNLCTNAAHAMSENGGVMEVSLSVIEFGKNKTIQNVELNQGQYLKITVSDTGYGIAKENLDKIFDPYFTTKEVGKGSGIGLSVVQRIIMDHHGSISVDSEYGKRTTFNLFLPVVENKPVDKDETDTKIPTGNERILFVDDEESITNMASQMLERLGYTVTAKTNSTDALETFRNQPDNFDLIISDMTMPDTTGDKLTKKLLTIRPDIPIILCTGFSEQINVEKAKLIGVQSLVMKPIVKSVLAKTIRNVLD
ncbi:MAG: ATP-binding response regulator [Planctomycetota bacterium]